MALKMTTTLDYLDEIRQLFSEDDAAGITSELEGSGFRSDGSNDYCSQVQRKQLCLVLGLAAVLAKDKSYSKEVTQTIIDHVSSVVDPFTVCSFIIHYKSIKKPKSYNCIPFSIRNALGKNVYTEKIGEEIAELPRMTTEALLFYIMDKIARLEPRFVAPLLKAAYQTIDGAMFYTFLEFSIKEPKNATAVAVVISGPETISPFDGEMVPVQISFCKGNKEQQSEEGKKEAASTPKEDDSTKA